MINKINAKRSVTQSCIITCSFVLIMAFSHCNAQSQQDSISVDAIYPQYVEKLEKLILTGSIEAQQRAQIGPLEAGNVAKIDFEIGDKVTQGQVLLILNNELAKLDVLSARAEVKVNEINVVESERLFKEAEKLSDQKVVAKTLKAERAARLSSAKAQLEIAKVTLKIQQERLNRHTLKAPFEGVITQRNVNVGQWVTQQTDALTLVAENQLRLTIAIPQHHFKQLNQASKVAVTVIPDSQTSQSFSATLSRIVPESSMNTRTFLAQIDLPNDAGLYPGMSANAEISVPMSEHTKIILPRSALKQHPDGGSSIFVVQNNTAKRILTKYTALPNNKIAITNHTPNQAYVISSVELLQDGMPIKVNLMETENSQAESDD